MKFLSIAYYVEQLCKNSSSFIAVNMNDEDKARTAYTNITAVVRATSQESRWGPGCKLQLGPVHDSVKVWAEMFSSTCN